MKKDVDYFVGEARNWLSRRDGRMRLRRSKYVFL